VSPRSQCDVCGGSSHVRTLTTAEREVWPAIAGWIRLVCPLCLSYFRRSHAKSEKAEA